ncbi:MAG: M1 family aminopeptidase [Gemmatimonadales bacterium]
MCTPAAVALALPAVLLLPFPISGQTPAVTHYETTYTELRAARPQRDGVATVRRLVLRRDVLELRLDSGTVQLFTPVAGRTIVAAFTGRGSVSFVPPLAIERAHLRRVMDDSTIAGPIDAAVLVFTDSTLSELRRAGPFGPGSPAGDAGGHADEAFEYLIDGRAHTADPGLMMRLLSDSITDQGFFAAYIKRAEGEGVLVRIDPYDIEEIQLLRRGRLQDQRTETVCQFERAADLARGDAAPDTRPEPLSVDEYTIEATIDGNYKFSATAALRITGRRDRHRWVPLLLFNELEIDAVTDSAGAPLPFYRGEHSPELWVQLDAPAAPGDARRVRVAYHGDLIGFGSALDAFLPPWWDESRRRMPPVLDSWAFIKSTDTWYPRYSFWQPATMTLTFHTPKDLQFASIGKLVESRVEDDVRTTRWVTEVPTQQASFNIGKFDEIKVTDPRIPPVTVHVNLQAHASLRAFVLHARNPEESVTADVTNSLAFFTQVFGEPLFQHYYATEIPYFHGQAFPGMIHLSWWTYLGMSTNGADESFRAHEMAHQWWGIGVEPATYRDAWISEGFAEFAGLWYMQMVLQDNDKYFKQLREAREEIRRQRNKAMPIGLGYRALENWQGRYSLGVYQKGAWVLHMLRNMMIDLRTMDEGAFMRMMHDFYTSFRGRHASTRDFQRVVERHLGQPLDWFFQQWVDGTAVPSYHCSWTTEPREGGGYTLRIRVRQEDVPDDFRMPLPVIIKFAEGRAPVRIMVKGPLSEVALAVPAEPQDLEFNPFESVLAEVETEGWR